MLYTCVSVPEGISVKPISLTQLQCLLEGMRGKRVLVVGDVFLYEYVWGRMTEISTEGPVPVVRVHGRSYAPGAAGNTAVGMAELGACVKLCGCTGDDANGRMLAECLAAKGVDVSAMVKTGSMPTNAWTKISAGGFHSSRQEVLRTHTAPPGRISAQCERAVRNAIDAAVAEVDAIVLVDQLSSVVTREIVDHVIELRQKHPIIVVGDSRDNVRDMRGMDLIVPNDYEAGTAINLTVDSDAAVERAGDMLLGCQKLQNVIITRGRDGLTVFSRNSGPVHLRTQVLEVFDVTGAGDTVTAVTAGVLLAGGSAVEAGQIANLAAGVAVSRVGTVAVSAADILDAHARFTGIAPSSKIKTLEELHEIVRELREEGCRIGWTNGCFDILHTGHIAYLRKARQAADVLLLGISGDRTVRELKGAGRPINSENERAEVLAELACIDYVIVFQELSPANILEQLKPDIYIKGGDYTIDTINQEERRIVESYGGGIQLLGHVEGTSTTEIISRILRQHQQI